MLKLPSNGMKKGMHILLAAFFVVSLTAVHITMVMVAGVAMAVGATTNQLILYYK
jgi:hypothetical protein